jgi:ribosomal protein L29
LRPRLCVDAPLARRPPQEVESTKKELILLNVKKATRQEVKAHHFVLLRKKVAMLKTIRRERELEQGVKKRASRSLDTMMALTKTYW